MLFKFLRLFDKTINGANMRAIKLNGGNVEINENQFLSYSSVLLRVKISFI